MNVPENEKSVYDHVQDFVEPLHLRVTASYLFGFFIAKVLQGHLQPKDCMVDLEKQLKLEVKHCDKLRPLIEHLIGYIYHNLTHDWLSMDQMLPNIDMPISSRIYSLSELVQAFLQSMGDNISAYCDVTDDLQEILSDFKSLAEMDMDEEDSEESERDYIEIVEYVRIGILLMTEHSYFFAQEKQAKVEQTHH